MSRIRVLVGTRKGAFILTADGKRERWDVSGPHFAGWEIYHVKGSPADPNRLYASQSSGWFGQHDPALRTTAARRGSRSATQFAYDGVPGTHQWYDGTPHPWEFARVWHLEPSLTDPDTVYAGVEDAALFRSTDGGADVARALRTARPRLGAVAGSRAPAGCACTRSCSTRRDPERIFVAISAAGAFRSDDGGTTWRPINRGLKSEGIPDPDAEVGHCVHRIAMHPSRPDVLFMQKHWDVMRSDDAGESWHEVSGNLPTDFGFAIDVHAHEPETIYVVPIKSDSEHFPLDGKLRVYRSRTRRQRVGTAHERPAADATATSTCCATRWRSTRSIRAASTSARPAGRCTRRPTPATAGRRSCATCRRCCRSKCRRCRDPRRPARALAHAGPHRRRGDGSTVAGAVTQRSVLDALEARYPVLRGTIRDRVTRQPPPVRAFLRLRATTSRTSARRAAARRRRRGQRTVAGRRRHGGRLTPGAEGARP